MPDHGCGCVRVSENACAGELPVAVCGGVRLGVGVGVCPHTGQRLQREAESPSGDQERTWPVGSVGIRFSRGCRGLAAGGCAHSSFLGSVLELRAVLRSSVLGGPPGGGILCWLGVSEGPSRKRRPALGISWESRGRSGEQAGEGSHSEQGMVTKGRLPRPSAGQPPLPPGPQDSRRRGGPRGVLGGHEGAI